MPWRRTSPLDPAIVMQRNELWVVLFKCLEGLRDDFLPGEPFYQAFTKIIIMHHMFQPYFHNERGSTVTELARKTGVPRQTVDRKVGEMVKQGIVEPRGRKFVPVLAYFDANQDSLRKFQRRREVLLRTLLGEQDLERLRRGCRDEAWRQRPRGEP
jgi:DNA-binding transcriptional regulator YhcF (GntR family)